MEHDMAVNELSETEAKAIVLSLRSFLSLENEKAVSLEHIHQIAYLQDRATKMFLMALECD